MTVSTIFLALFKNIEGSKQAHEMHRIVAHNLAIMLLIGRTKHHVINDLIDLSAITAGVGSYLGEAGGYGQVLTSLTASGDAEAVLDTSTSTLYIDVDGSGTLDNVDMAIELTGITDLSLDNFTF